MCMCRNSASTWHRRTGLGWPSPSKQARCLQKLAALPAPARHLHWRSQMRHILLGPLDPLLRLPWGKMHLIKGAYDPLAVGSASCCTSLFVLAITGWNKQCMALPGVIEAKVRQAFTRIGPDGSKQSQSQNPFNCAFLGQQSVRFGSS